MADFIPWSSDTRTYFFPFMPVLEPFQHREATSEDLEKAEIVELPLDYSERLRMIQIYLPAEHKNTATNWGCFSKACSFGSDGVVCEEPMNGVATKLRALLGMYGMLMCGDVCIGVYNTVMGAWIGPPYDRRIANYVGADFYPSVPAGLPFSEEGRGRIFLIRNREEIGKIFIQ